ncbi:exonuclease domain-containing protein [Oceanirhabdus sp. W0125-5]|uniref:exonuclease domain-containing protein n=1 Tax=Oceanirhabdus sp. W0125-5 TaxID=2999116 RepID=UPI0022F3243E|nr:exonuclease domain-containing protein [Oceanirhabdus sp. W0125-5]WBW99136.1 exonuclease domain-containing protein [Oceanirhabdus sp. W0125-5]
MKRRLDFVAIDFETANEKRNSACALGITVVESGEVVEEKYWLIKPYENRFAPMNIWIHGITQEDVEDSPTFDEIWNEIKPYIEGKFVIAHNAAFDISVLRRTLDTYNIQYPSFQYACTVVMSKNYYDGVANYKLNTLANALGIEFKHHHASEDATAAARIFIEICKGLEIDSCDDIENKLFIRVGKVFEGGYNSCGKSKSVIKGFELRRKFIEPSERKRVIIDSLKDKTVVFTGPLGSMSRIEAMASVRSASGTAGSSVTRKTDYLVTGIKGRDKLSNSNKSTKYRKAESLIDKGYNIKIISDEEYFQIIYGEKSS